MPYMQQLTCWVVRVNRLYLIEWSLGSVRMDRDLQRAFRYQNQRDAEFVAKKVGGEAVTCRIGSNGLEVVRA